MPSWRNMGQLLAPWVKTLQVKRPKVLKRGEFRTQLLVKIGFTDENHREIRDSWRKSAFFCGDFTPKPPGKLDVFFCESFSVPKKHHRLTYLDMTRCSIAIF